MLKIDSESKVESVKVQLGQQNLGLQSDVFSFRELLSF